MVAVLASLLVLTTASVPAVAQVTAPAPPNNPALAASRQADVDIASYDLEARWDPATNQIAGTATITYRNDTGDTLPEIWLKLYLNAFRDAQTQWMRESEGSHRGTSFDPDRPGWITLERVRLVDTGEDVLPASIDPAATVLRVPLPAARAIAPGQSLRLDVAWTSQLPRVFARTGVAGDFVMAGQWYPKLAVYDRGAWDTEPWHAASEFFADFGAYTLALTVPSSYVIGATGTRDGTVNNADGTTTHRFWANSVSDVAWTAWPEYRVATKPVQAAGQTVELELLAPRSLNTGQDERFFVAAQRALDHLGTWFGPYPWPKLTLVVPPSAADGAGGMEYPMLVTLTEPNPAPFGLERGVREVEVVTIHEIAHQWAPLQVATNEGREAWLDEGFADYATMRVLAQMYPPDRTFLDLGPLHLGYEGIQRSQYVVESVGEPLTTPSWEYDSFLTYASAVYSKGSLTFLSLERTVGEERFLAAMRGYFDQWRWRHPTTADLQQSLETGTGSALGWFFEPLVFGTGTVEYRVSAVTARRATIERVGNVQYPVVVALTYADGRTERITWDDAGPTLTIDESDGNLRRVQVDPDDAILLEANMLDNGREAQPSPVPLLAIAARLLGLVQAALLAGVVG
jgi:hypothetical protein